MQHGFLFRCSMRIDKFLKVSRVIKRRSVANEACDGGRVSVNDKPVKAGYDVKIGDIVEISFGNRKTKFRIIKILDNPKKDEAESLYEMIS